MGTCHSLAQSCLHRRSANVFQLGFCSAHTVQYNAPHSTTVRPQVPAPKTHASDAACRGARHGLQASQGTRHGPGPEGESQQTEPAAIAGGREDQKTYTEEVNEMIMAMLGFTLLLSIHRAGCSCVQSAACPPGGSMDGGNGLSHSKDTCNNVVVCQECGQYCTSTSRGTRAHRAASLSHAAPGQRIVCMR